MKRSSESGILGRSPPSNKRFSKACFMKLLQEGRGDLRILLGA
jgi:hypothetical protein